MLLVNYLRLLHLFGIKNRKCKRSFFKVREQIEECLTLFLQNNINKQMPVTHFHKAKYLKYCFMIR